MAIKENALPVSQSIGSGDYLRKVSSGGVSQQVPFSEVKGAVVTVDSAIDSESENPVQNKAIAAALDAAGTQTQQDIASAIQTEVTDRNAAIASAIDDEETARNTAISEAVAAEAQAREAADEELDQTKANTDGNYPDMTVGNADQLLSSIYTEDQIPYNFRQAGGGLSIGDREIDKIVGGTIAWNQLVTGFVNRSAIGVTITDNSNGSITITGTPTSTNNLYFTSQFTRIIGHKYLLRGSKGVGAIGFESSSTKDTGNGTIINVPGGVNSRLVYYTTEGVAINETLYPQLFDLTQMFGSAIADYLYSLEQATAGAGVSFFRKLFPKPYYAYNAGELMSVQAASHDMVGFNAWDEDWESGAFNTTTGVNTASLSQIRSKNPIPILPNTTYYFNTSNSYAWVIFLDADENVIEGYYASAIKSGNSSSLYNTTFVTPPNGAYMKFYLLDNYGTTYNNDICINLAHNGSRNGEYEPYEKHSYELDSGLTLRGIPKLDASNNLYYDGDEYESDGSVNRRYGVVDMGTLDWSLLSANRFWVMPSGMKPFTHNLVSIQYVEKNIGIGSLNDREMTTQAGSGELYVKDTRYEDATAFKSAMSGVMLVYELATSTEESAAPYTNPQTVSDWGTEEYVDAAVQEGDGDVAVPVGHVTDYLANLRDKLQNLPDAANADGTYLVQQTSGQMALLAYTPGVNIPAAPTTDGTYTLQAVVSGGVATYSWVSS